MPLWSDDPTAEEDWGPPPPAPSGLAGFFSNPDFGTELGERLGMIGEILSRTGSGRGLAGISAEMGAMNERSSARKTRRQQLTMVNRAADKIEERNPELAAMMRADPAFGMQLLGKKFASEWEADADIRKAEKMLPWEIKKLTEIEKVKADVAEKARKAQSDRLYFSIMGRMPGEEAPAAPTTSQTDTAPAPSAVTAEPNVGLGTGNEPAPSVTPPVTPDTVTPGAVTPDQPPVTPDQAPAALEIPPEPLSPRKEVAALQQKLASDWGIPVAAADATMIFTALATNDPNLQTIIGNIQQRYDQKKQVLQQEQWARQKIESDRRYAEQADERNMAEFNSSVPPIEPAAGGMGPMPRGTAQPGQDPRTVGVLQSQGLQIGRDIQPDLADLTARQIEAGARQGDVGGALGSIKTEVAKRGEDRAATQQLRATQAQMSRIVTPLLEQPDVPPEDKARIQAMLIGKPENMAEEIGKLSALSQDRIKTAQDQAQFEATQDLAVKKREDDEIERAFQRGITSQDIANKNDAAQIAREQWDAKVKADELATKTQAEAKAKGAAVREAAGIQTIGTIAKIANEMDKAELPTTGLPGYIFSFTGGDTAPGRIAGLLQTVISNQALSEIQNLRTLAGEVGSEGTGLGQTMLKEFQALETRTANFSQFANTPESMMTELKTIANMQLDIIFGKGQGPYRLVVNGETSLERVPPDDPAGQTDWEEAIAIAEKRGTGATPPNREEGAPVPRINPDEIITIRPH